MINHPRRSKKNPHPLDAARDAALSTIQKIADRAVPVYAQNDVRVERLNVLMDISACHFGVQKLRLDDLLAADDFNFMHDVGGINRHQNRMTNELDNGFSPRFSERKAA